MGMYGDFSSSKKKKLSKEELEKKARKIGFTQSSTFTLPEIVSRKGKK